MRREIGDRSVGGAERRGHAESVGGVEAPANRCPLRPAWRGPMKTPGMEALQKPATWDLVACGYDEFVVPSFDAFARRAVHLLELQAGARALDVACGPGTASAVLAEQGHDVTAVDFSAGMLDRLRNKLGPGGALEGKRIEPHVMDGQSLALEASQFDGALSMFGLMFFPDRARGFAELHRVLRPGARACVSSWLPISELPALKWLFGTIEVMRPSPPDPTPRAPVLEDPQVFAAEMTAAGFCDVHVERVDHGLPIPEDIEEFWQSMVQSSAPIALMKASMSETQWQAANEKALDHLHRTRPADLVSFGMSAWLGVGCKPA